MSIIPFNAVVISSNQEGTVVEYSSPGRAPVRRGVPTPTTMDGQSLEDIVLAYSPVASWIDADTPRVVPAVGVVVSFAPPEPEPVTLATAKRDKLAALAAWRYQRETSGLNIGGSIIRTDRESQGQITSAYTSLKNALVSSVNFKAANGQFVALTLADIEPIASAVANHVQACFTAEMALAAEIEACATIEAVQAVDFE